MSRGRACRRTRRSNPLKKEEVEALIKACDFSQEAVTDWRRKFIMPRPTGKRDKAILLHPFGIGRLRALIDRDRALGQFRILHDVIYVARDDLRAPRQTIDLSRSVDQTNSLALLD